MISAYGRRLKSRYKQITTRGLLIRCVSGMFSQLKNFHCYHHHRRQCYMCLCDKWLSDLREQSRALSAEQIRHIQGTSPAMLASLWCQAGDRPWWPLLGWRPPQLSESSRRHGPGSTSAGGFWSLSEYPEIYKLQPLFPLQHKRQRTKEMALFRQSENWAHQEKVNSGPPRHIDFKYQKEVLMPPSPVFHFIYASVYSVQYFLQAALI